MCAVRRGETKRLANKLKISLINFNLKDLEKSLKSKCLTRTYTTPRLQKCLNLVRGLTFFLIFPSFLCFSLSFPLFKFQGGGNVPPPAEYAPATCLYNIYNKLKERFLPLFSFFDKGIQNLKFTLRGTACQDFLHDSSKKDYKIFYYFNMSAWASQGGL